MNGLSAKSLLLRLIVTGGLSLLPDQSAPPQPQTADVNRPAPLPSKDGGPRVDRYGDPLPEGALHRFGTVRFRFGNVHHSDLSSDGKTLAVCSQGSLVLFDVETGKPRLRLRDAKVPGFPEFDFFVALAPDRKTFASIARDGTVRVWDAATGKELRRFGKGNDIRYADDGKTLLIQDRDLQARFVDLESGKTLRDLYLAGTATGFSSDRKIFVVITLLKSEIALHETATGKVLQRFPAKGRLQRALLTPDGNMLIAANDTSRIFVWEVKSGKLVREIQPPTPPGKELDKSLTTMAVTPDSKTLLASPARSWDGQGAIFRWDLATGKELPLLLKHKNLILALLPLPDGKTCVSVGNDHHYCRWDVATGKEIAADDGYAGSIRLALAADGRIATIGCRDSGRLDVWDTTTGERVRTLRNSGPSVTGLVFSPDGKMLAVGQSDNWVTLWDTATWNEIRAFKLPTELKPGYSAWFSALTFSPDSRSLLTSCHDGTRLWEVATGKDLWHQPDGGSADFAPDGNTLATGPLLTFRDPATGKKRFALTPENGGTIHSLVYAPDGRTLATTHWNGIVRLRDPNTGEEKKSLEISKEIVGEVAFSPDGCWLLSACLDGRVRIHEVASGQQVLELPGHDAWVLQGVFGPDGKSALTTGLDLTALYWSLRPADVTRAKGRAEALWDDLHSEKAALAYRAQWALLDDPAVATELLRRKLPPTKPKLDRSAMLKLIADLDAREFRTRQEATKALAALEWEAEPYLRKALAKPVSIEQEQRIQILLAQLKPPPALDEVRILRAVQVVGLCATPDARQLLRDWADGAPGLLLTERAKEALSRMR